MKQAWKIDVVIPTCKPDDKFDRLMQMLKKQTYPLHEILIVNTGEADFPQKGYETWQNVRIVHIKKEEFDHGGTRDGAAGLLDGDRILFVTQDAVPADIHLVERLAAAFEDEQVAAAYARQIPARDCDLLERYTRAFNYPKQSSVKTKADLPQYGVKTFFCSNVCAMYRRDVYTKLGGFEKHTIFNEDMIFAGRLIQEGWAVAYVAEAAVIHSHNYSVRQQFHRNFDLAVSQADHPEIFQMARSESEGIRMVKQTAVWLFKTGRFLLLPLLVTRSAGKYAGYRLGRQYQKLPKKVILRLTMNRTYWERKWGESERR